MIKGVPEELQVAYNLNSQQYDLLGVMADAADENGEPEVAECLRWLWRWKRVAQDYDGEGWGWGWGNDWDIQEAWADRKMWWLPFSLKDRCPLYDTGDSALRAVERITIGFPKWKQQYSEEYQRLSVPPSTLIQPTTPS